MSVRDAIESLQAEAKAIEERLDGINIAIAELQKYSAVEIRKPKRTRIVVESQSARVRRSIADALFDAGMEMHRKELMAILREQELYPGQEPEKEMRNMASQLSDDDRFERTSDSGSGYWRLTEGAYAELSKQADAVAGLADPA